MADTVVQLYFTTYRRRLLPRRSLSLFLSVSEPLRSGEHRKRSSHRPLLPKVPFLQIQTWTPQQPLRTGTTNHNHKPNRSLSIQTFSGRTPYHRSLVLCHPSWTRCLMSMLLCFQLSLGGGVYRYSEGRGGRFVVPFIDVHEETTQMTEEHTHTTAPHLTYHPMHITTLALIKRTTHLDPLVPLST